MKCPKCYSNNPDTKPFCADCGTQLTPPGEAPPSFTKTLETPVSEYPRGTLFANRYEIIEELGRGGMGAVYRVEDKKLKQEIALKLIKPEISSDNKTIERFSNELKTARMVAHKNVCRMFDLSEDKGTHYITMEYVPGEDLKSLIHRIGRLPIDKALAIAGQIAGGLSEAHRLGIVHRDLKPGNIMVDKDGNAKIMDFGIARSGETTQVTGTGVIIGTPEYMSPEQAEAENLDRRSDLYSLGIILYEMVTGQVPFTGKTGLSVAMKQKGELPKDPREINPQVPDELCSLILKCLEKDREQRYETAEELKQELNDLARLLPSTRTKISRKKARTSRELTVTISPRKLLLPAAALLVLVLIALFLWKPWATSRLVSTPEDRPSLAILPFTNNTTEPDLDKYRTVFADALQFYLEQSKYLYTIPKERLLTVFERLSLDNNKDFSSKDIENLISHGIGNYILTAQYFKSGEAFRINYTIRDVSLGKALFLDYIEGQGEDSLLGLVEAMSSRIKEFLNIEETEVEDRAYGVIPTTSLEAFRYYSEGTSLYHRGKREESLPLLEKAIELDPEMALAYRQIGAYYGNKGDRKRGKEYTEKALRLADRIPERHRLAIQATYEWAYGGEGGKERTLELLKKLLQDYPEDLIGNRLLALTYRDLGDMDKAIEQGEKVIRLYPESLQEVINILLVYIPSFEFEKGCELLENTLDSFPEDVRIRNNLLWLYMYAGKLDLALAHLDKYPSDFEPPFYLKARGWIYQLQGELQKAEEEYLALSQEKNDRDQDDGKYFLALLELQQGKVTTAEIILKELLELARQRGKISDQIGYLLKLSHVYNMSYRYDQALKSCEDVYELVMEEGNVLQKTLALIQKGKALLALGFADKARICGEELVTVMDSFKSWRGGKTGWHKHLLGLIALKEGNYDNAIELFSNSTPKWVVFPLQIPSAYLMLMEPLAQAYYDKGDYEKAREEYEKIISANLIRIGWGDIYVRSFYMLGKIYEQQGDTTKAIENYEKFLDIWKDADPGIAEVDDARERVSKLKI